jgi:hypothetical protein
MVARRRWRHYLALPLCILAIPALFYLALALT